MLLDDHLDEMLEHITDPCPLGCGDADFNWWPIQVEGVYGSVYAYDCPVCGYFVVPGEERERLLRRGEDFDLAEVRRWLREENRSDPPCDYQRWPWLNQDMLLMFNRKMLLA